jgi:glycine/D-amino acid oxidase-like deaminating enzyme
MAKFGYDIAVVGGGTVGGAIAYGVARLGHKVILLDEGDVAHRAAVGNFGLIWVQGKGLGRPAYGAWTRASVSSWPAFAETLRGQTGIDVAFEQRGGLLICLTDEELEERRARARRMESESAGQCPVEMLDRANLSSMVPGLGPEVRGASYCPLDGHCNPLDVLRALHAAFLVEGGRYRGGARVDNITRDGEGYILHTASGAVGAGRVVLAAGLGNATLAPMVGLHVPARPQRGQILVTERVAPMLSLPTGLLRQTREGSLLIGDSKEEVGFDEGTTTEVMARMAAQAVKTLPALRRVRVVRAWGSLRVMTPDTLPVYEQSVTHPGAFLVTCHSGLTLAAVHAGELSEAISQGTLPTGVESFRVARFDGAA